jgi:hypothetical protein
MGLGIPDWAVLALALLAEALVLFALFRWQRRRPRESPNERWWLPLSVFALIAVVSLASVYAALRRTTPSPYSPVAHWTFLASYGDRVIDLVGGYAGKLFSPQWRTTTEHFSGNVLLHFDGEKTFIAVPPTRALEFQGAFTIAAWLRPESNRARQILFQRADEHDFRKAPVTVYTPWGEGRLGLVLSDGQKRVGFLSDRAIRAKTWQHVAVTYEEDRIRFYIDGELAGERTTRWRPPQLPPGPIYIGMGRVGEKGFYPFQGELESLTIYHRALTQTEIEKLSRRLPFSAAAQ